VNLSDYTILNKSTTGPPLRGPVSIGRLTQWLECVLHTDEVTGSNPVSPTRPKAFLPKQFLLTLGCPGCGFRTTRTVESFHSSARGIRTVSTRRNPTPSYLPHKRSGRARAVWTDTLGERHQKLLPGKYDSLESRTAFARLQLELETSPLASLIDSAYPTGISVNELCLAYTVHAEQHYLGRDGKPTDEIRHVKTVSRFVRELYGLKPASEFGPLALKAVRQKFIEEKWCRKTVNARIERVKRIFKWGVAEEHVSPVVYQAFAAVSGLQHGRTPAQETEPVAPVEDAIVGATL
jgi:hypothetical protein